MEYPPWLPEPELSRRGMLLALARCVYEVWYRPEAHSLEGEVWIFDNMCSGDLERVSSVLQKAGFTRFLDSYQRRSTFNCGPGEFESIAAAAPADNLSTSEIEKTIIRLAEGNRVNLEIEWLAKKLVANG